MKTLKWMTTLVSLCTAASAHAGNGVLSNDLIKIARESLASIQEQSFESKREYCGLIGLTSAGELIVTPARRGRTNGCSARDFADRTITPVASYHTHGAFHPDADSEVPSTHDADMLTHAPVTPRKSVAWDVCRQTRNSMKGWRAKFPAT